MRQGERGRGGVDGQSLEEFERQLDSPLNRLQYRASRGRLKASTVRQMQIRQAGKPGQFRKLGIPTIYDRVCQ